MVPQAPLEFYLVHTGVGTDPYWKGVADGFVDFCQQAGMVGVVRALGASGKSEKERIEDQFEEIQKLIQEQREGPMGLILSAADPVLHPITQGQDAQATAAEIQARYPESTVNEILAINSQERAFKERFSALLNFIADSTREISIHDKHIRKGRPNYYVATVDSTAYTISNAVGTFAPDVDVIGYKTVANIRRKMTAAKLQAINRNNIVVITDQNEWTNLLIKRESVVKHLQPLTAGDAGTHIHVLKMQNVWGNGEYEIKQHFQSIGGVLYFNPAGADPSAWDASTAGVAEIQLVVSVYLAPLKYVPEHASGTPAFVASTDYDYSIVPYMRSILSENKLLVGFNQRGMCVLAAASILEYYRLKKGRPRMADSNLRGNDAAQTTTIAEFVDPNEVFALVGYKESLKHVLEALRTHKAVLNYKGYNIQNDTADTEAKSSEALGASSAVDTVTIQNAITESYTMTLKGPDGSFTNRNYDSKQETFYAWYDPEFEVTETSGSYDSEIKIEIQRKYIGVRGGEEQLHTIYTPSSESLETIKTHLEFPAFEKNRVEYTVAMKDTFGDGWNGYSLDIQTTLTIVPSRTYYVGTVYSDNLSFSLPANNTNEIKYVKKDVDSDSNYCVYYSYNVRTDSNKGGRIQYVVLPNPETNKTVNIAWDEVKFRRLQEFLDASTSYSLEHDAKNIRWLADNVNEVVDYLAIVKDNVYEDTISSGPAVVTLTHPLRVCNDEQVAGNYMRDPRDSMVIPWHVDGIQFKVCGTGTSPAIGIAFEPLNRTIVLNYSNTSTTVTQNTVSQQLYVSPSQEIGIQKDHMDERMILMLKTETVASVLGASSGQGGQNTGVSPLVWGSLYDTGTGEATFSTQIPPSDEKKTFQVLASHAITQNNAVSIGGVTIPPQIDVYMGAGIGSRSVQVTIPESKREALENLLNDLKKADRSMGTGMGGRGETSGFSIVQPVMTRWASQGISAGFIEEYRDQYVNKYLITLSSDDIRKMEDESAQGKVILSSTPQATVYVGDPNDDYRFKFINGSTGIVQTLNKNTEIDIVMEKTTTGQNGQTEAQVVQDALLVNPTPQSIHPGSRAAFSVYIFDDVDDTRRRYRGIDLLGMVFFRSYHPSYEGQYLPVKTRDNVHLGDFVGDFNKPSKDVMYVTFFTGGAMYRGTQLNQFNLNSQDNIVYQLGGSTLESNLISLGGYTARGTGFQLTKEQIEQGIDTAIDLLQILSESDSSGGTGSGGTGSGGTGSGGTSSSGGTHHTIGPSNTGQVKTGDTFTLNVPPKPATTYKWIYPNQDSYDQIRQNIDQGWFASKIEKIEEV